MISAMTEEALLVYPCLQPRHDQRTLIRSLCSDEAGTSTACAEPELPAIGDRDGISTARARRENSSDREAAAFELQVSQGAETGPATRSDLASQVYRQLNASTNHTATTHVEVDAHLGSSIGVVQTAGPSTISTTAQEPSKLVPKKRKAPPREDPPSLSAISGTRFWEQDWAARLQHWAGATTEILGSSDAGLDDDLSEQEGEDSGLPYDPNAEEDIGSQSSVQDESQGIDNDMSDMINSGQELNRHIREASANEQSDTASNAENEPVDSPCTIDTAELRNEGRPFVFEPIQDDSDNESSPPDSAIDDFPSRPADVSESAARTPGRNQLNNFDRPIAESRPVMTTAQSSTLHWAHTDSPTAVRSFDPTCRRTTSDTAVTTMGRNHGSIARLRVALPAPAAIPELSRPPQRTPLATLNVPSNGVIERAAGHPPSTSADDAREPRSQQRTPSTALNMPSNGVVERAPMHSISTPADDTRDTPCLPQRTPLATLSVPSNGVIDRAAIQPPSTPADATREQGSPCAKRQARQQETPRIAGPSVRIGSARRSIDPNTLSMLPVPGAVISGSESQTKVAPAPRTQSTDGAESTPPQRPSTAGSDQPAGPTAAATQESPSPAEEAQCQLELTTQFDNRAETVVLSSSPAPMHTPDRLVSSLSRHCRGSVVAPLDAGVIEID